MIVSRSKRTVLLSGATGFLGQIIKKNISDEDIITIGRTNTHILCDLSYNIPDLGTRNIDIVIHSAGKAHSIPKTHQQKQEFYDVNVNGTNNLLKGIEQSPALPKSFIFMSSVAVYGINEGVLINENNSLSANDPYGLSKIQGESLVQEWCAKNNVIYTILRLPLIAGPNPPGNLKSMINGIKKGYYFNISEGVARKSIVLAEDVARIIPKAAEIGGVYNLTDGYHPSFAELSKLMAKQLGKRTPANIPGWLANTIAKVGDLMGSKAPLNSDKLRKITSDLTFDDTKAREILGWNPTPVLEGFKIS